MITLKDIVGAVGARGRIKDQPTQLANHNWIDNPWKAEENFLDNITTSVNDAFATVGHDVSFFSSSIIVKAVYHLHISISISPSWRSRLRYRYVRATCLMSMSNIPLEQSVTSLTSELWPSIKSSLRAPWRNLRLQSPPAVASVPQSLPAQRTASIEVPIAKSNVSIIWLRLFDHPLTLTANFNTGAARLLSISAHGHSQISTPGSGHAHQPIINKWNYPYVASASLFRWICAYRYSLLQDASVCKSTLFRDLIHVPDNPVLLNITTLSIHTRLQTIED